MFAKTIEGNSNHNTPIRWRTLWVTITNATGKMKQKEVPSGKTTSDRYRRYLLLNEGRPVFSRKWWAVWDRFSRPSQCCRPRKKRRHHRYISFGFTSHHVTSHHDGYQRAGIQCGNHTIRFPLLSVFRWVWSEPSHLQTQLLNACEAVIFSLTNSPACL